MKRDSASGDKIELVRITDKYEPVKLKDVDGVRRFYLKKEFPQINGHPLDNKKVKLAAGWLIEQCGWKGKRVGNTGSHFRQALVLVNYGGAKGSEVLAFAEEIKKSVKNKFGIELEEEINII